MIKMRNLIGSILFLVLTLNGLFSQNLYENIPRTRLSFIIPEGYELMNSAIGLQKNDSLYITFIDELEGNFFDIQKSFERKSIEKDGHVVIDLFDTIIDGFPAVFANVIRIQNQQKGYQLIFGDSTFFAYVQSIHPGINEKLEEEIMNSFFSLKYDTNKAIDYFESVKFEFDTTNTVFQFNSFNANMYSFSPNEKLENENNKSARVNIGLIDLKLASSFESASRFIDLNMEKSGFYGFIVSSSQKHKIDEYNGLTMFGDCFYGVKKIYFNKTILISNKYCVIAMGVCEFKDELMKSEMDKFIKTVRIKN